MTRARDLAAFVSNADGDIKFDTDTLFIDSSANKVGINNNAPVEFLTVGDTSDSASKIQMLSSTSGVNTIHFGDGASAAAYRGYINYAHSTDAMAIGTGASDKVIVNTDGDVGVGVSPTTSYGNVLQIHDTGTSGSSLRLTDSNSGAGTGNGGELLQLNTAMYLMNRENGLLSFSTNDEQVQVIDANGNTTFPKQPAFRVTKQNNTQANFAVNSDVTVTWPNEVFDVGSNFASNTFTAPVTGKYVFSVLLRVDSVDIDSNYYIPFINTSNQKYRFIVAPKFTSDPAYYSFALTCMADMDANDTCSIMINQGSGAAASDISGDNDYTWWTGYLAC